MSDMEETVREWRFGRVTARVVSTKSVGRLPPYDLPPRVWRRAARMAAALGVERALELADARAERCLECGKPRAAIRWRDLMIAFHEVSGVEDDGRPFDA